MSEVQTRSLEESLLENGDFRYEPQRSSEISDHLDGIEIVKSRVHTVNFISTVLPDDIDFICIKANKPRKLPRDEIAYIYAYNKMWWSVLGRGALDDVPVDAFETEQIESFIIAEDERVGAVVHNFDKPLSPESINALHDAYAWFEQFTQGDFSGMVDKIVLHTDLGTNRYLGGPIERKTLGLYSPPMHGHVSLAHFGANEEIVNERYAQLFELGHSLDDIVVTHEFAHALSFETGQLNVFEDLLQWERHKYKTGRIGKRVVSCVMGQGHDAPPPPTDYASINHKEDFAESMVFFRFAPHLLDGRRRKFFEDLKNKNIMHANYRAGLAGEQPATPVTDIVPTSQPIYPYRPLPSSIRADIISTREYQRNELLEMYMRNLTVFSNQRSFRDL